MSASVRRSRNPPQYPAGTGDQPDEHDQRIAIDEARLQARGDEQTIDRFGPHGAAALVGVGNRITTRFQSGYVTSYALVMLLGLVGAATWVFWWVR